MKIMLWLFTLVFTFSFTTKTKKINEIPTTEVLIACLNMGAVKDLVVVSSEEEYSDFIKKSSAANILGGDCLNYQAPKINFNVYHLFIVHGICGGCEKPIIEKSFQYNQANDKYEYNLTFHQNGICKAAHHFFESVLVKKIDIDLSKLTFSSKTIMPPREIRE